MTGTKTQTTTNSSEPYAAFKPALDQVGKMATGMLKDGSMAPVYTGSTVVPYSKQTLGAYKGAMQAGKAARPAMRQGLASLQGVIGSGGFNDPMNEAMTGLRGVIDQTSSQNPYQEQVIDAASRRAQDAINLQASGMGRTGSTANMEAVGRGITDVASGYLSDQYNRDLSTRMGALSQLFDMGQTGTNNVFNANAGLGSAYDNIQATYRPQADYGAAMEDLYGRTLNDKIRIEQGQQNQGLDSLRNLMGLFGGGQYATQTQSAQVPNNTLSNIAGLGLGGLSMLGGAKGWW